MTELIPAILSALGVGGILLFFVRRYFSRKDAEEAADRKKREEFYRKIDIGLDTLRLLSYHRLSDEIERLLTKGFATPAERRVLRELEKNYTDHGWNGDMKERLEKVYHLRTDRPPKKEV